MKNLFKIATLSLALAAMTQSANAASQENIGYVNPSVLLQSHPLFTNPESEFVKKMKAEDAKFAEEEKALAEVEKKLAADAGALKAEETKVSASIQKKVATLEKEAPRLRSADIKKQQDAISAEAQTFQKKLEAFQKREDEFKAKAAAYQQKLAAAQRALSEEQHRVEKVAIEDIKKVISTVAKDKGYSLLLDSNTVMFTENENRDITEELVKQISSRPLPALPAAATQAK